MQITHAITTALSKEDITRQFPKVFSGIGLHKSIQAKFIVDNSNQPVTQKPRRIAYNLEKAVMQEEDRLIKEGVLEVVPDDVPTTWCTNPVVVPKPNKPGSIRYCSNMRVPNVAIKRPMTESLTVEDIKVRLNGAKVFSKLDMNEAYHQIALHPDSRHLTTFYGTRGRLRYKRLNFGTISAQDIFDKAMDDTTIGLDGVLHIRDDFVIFGKSTEEHDKRLALFLKRMEENGLTLSSKKSEIGVSSIEFFGVIFNKDGTKPSPKKVESLRSMSEPKDAGEVRSFLGMAQYSAQYIPNFANMSAPLRRLTKSTTAWSWGKEEAAAFNKIKDSLSEDSVLGFYQPNQKTKLMVDAGPHGLGLVLAQEKQHGWQAVACHSRSLTETEQKYSQFDREALAIRWACERCYVYLIGSSFTVVTDHNPLVPMFNNPHSRPTMRVEKWLMYLQQFSFTLEYSPGKYNVADYLSRHSIPATEKEHRKSKQREEIICSLVSASVPHAMSLSQVQEATKDDTKLQSLIPHIMQGTISKAKRDPSLSDFKFVFSELSYCNGIVMRGNQIVIPDSLQNRVLDICHEGHLGIVKCKKLLRSKVWFHGIDRKMEDKIARCIPCQAAVKRDERNPLQMTEMADYPWQRIAIDHCGPFPSGELLLVAIDEASRYPEVEIVKTTSAKETIATLEKMFATHGIPEHVKSDNGSAFRGNEFKQYSQEKGFHHHKITPRWPEANGLAENFMKNIGKLVKTATSEGKDWRKEIYVFLGKYRATPHPSTGVTPQSMLFGREIRSKLPQIMPSTISQEIRDRERREKEKQKEKADERRNTKEHKINPGDIVLVRQQQNNKTTSPYNIIPHKVEQVKGSMITAENIQNGKNVTRNSNHFKKIPKETAENVERESEEIDNPEETMDTHEENTPQPVPQEDPSQGSAELTYEQSAQPNPNPPLRRSQRRTRQPNWMKDYQ